MALFFAFAFNLSNLYRLKNTNLATMIHVGNFMLQNVFVFISFCRNFARTINNNI